MPMEKFLKGLFTSLQRIGDIIIALTVVHILLG